MTEPSLQVDCRYAWPGGPLMEFQLQTGNGLTLLTGPSGGGKSTLLGLICGTLRPRTGSIRAGGRVLCDTAAGVSLPPEQRHFGLLTQEACLFPHLSVEQNLRYGWKRRKPRQFDFDHAVDVLELRELLDRDTHTLSGGQAQRVALGRAVLSNPQSLLLDEPLSALDAPLKARIIPFIERVRQEYHLPVLLVTHEPELLLPLAESCLHLENGRIRVSPASDDSSAAD